VLTNLRLKQLDKQLDAAQSYEDWQQLADEHDEVSGKRRWRQVDQTPLYDFNSIRGRLDRLRELRARHDDVGLLFTLNEGIHGNMGGMGSSKLYHEAKGGTKKLIEDYVDEIVLALQHLAELESDDISTSDKLNFFYRANHCYGRSALMLSGGGILGFYHLGVVKTLLKQNMLPKVISGSSAGAMIAGVLGTHTDKELEKFYDPAHVHFEAEREAGFLEKMVYGKSPSLQVDDLEAILARMIPDMTFQEAYEKTGRQISVSVAPAEPQQTSRLLNAIASPNVFIRSAVMASCAVPGVFPPVTLQARNMYGKAQPYLPSRQWVDGSISDDLPAKRLGRLYSTNHSIVSMVNPIALPFLTPGKEPNKLLASLGKFGIEATREALNLYRSRVQKQGTNWPRVSALINGVHGLLDQNYTGDINIVPDFRWYNPTKLLSHITEEELVELMEAGERSTWRQLSAVDTCTRISRTLDDILERFEIGDLKPIRAARRRPKQPVSKTAKKPKNKARAKTKPRLVKAA
jgi:TAG lipase/steryl ester hydrolase/phospholipase A2/LPA acyltransferase